MLIPGPRHHLEHHPFKEDCLTVFHAAKTHHYATHERTPFGVVLFSDNVLQIIQRPLRWPRVQLIEFIQSQLFLNPNARAWGECHQVNITTDQQQLVALQVTIRHSQCPQPLLVYLPTNNPTGWWVEDPVVQ